MFTDKHKHWLLLFVLLLGAIATGSLSYGLSVDDFLPHAAEYAQEVLGEFETDVLDDTVAPSPSSDQREVALVARVVDGDTIVLADERRVRYIGVDTPETKAPNTPVQCFGEEAFEYNHQLVAGKYVELEKDVNDTDRYGRLLRYVYIDGAMVNLTLVEEGYAVARSYPPDIAHQDALREAEQRARQAEAGLWSSCPVE